MMAPDFINEQLALIRREFFRKASAKEWFQEQNLLRQAVAFPAAHLKERYGVTAKSRHGEKKLFSIYTRILRTVIETIKRHGDLAKIQRFSVYFLHSVQEHLKHHGEEYYEAAKAARSAEELLPDVMRSVRPGNSEPNAIDVLISVHDTLKSRGGRKRKPAPAQPSLF